MIDSRSITFKMAILLLAVSLTLIAAIVFIANYLFAAEYARMEHEKLAGLVTNVEPALVRSLSYGFDQAADEILQTLQHHEAILRVELSTPEARHVFGEHSAQTLRRRGHFLQRSTLYDPTSHIYLGKLTVVYSNHHYSILLGRFYLWLGVAVTLFLTVVIFALVFLFGALRPLRILAETMQTFNPSAPKALRLDTSGNDEVALIADAAQQMVGNIIQHTASLNALNAQLMQHRTHLNEAQHMAHVGSWEFRLGDGSFEMSEEMAHILHAEPGHPLTWESFLACVVDDDRDYVETLMGESVRTGSPFQLAYRIRSTGGETVDIQTHGKVEKRGEERIITAVSMDVTEQNRTRRLIEKLAYYDALTELPNRALFRDRLEKAMQSAKRNGHKLAVLFLDLDHFKYINDTLGHDVGDALLRHVSALLAGQLREVDTIARIGGDEFIVLLPQIDKAEDAAVVADKLITVLQVQHLIGSHTLYITTSIGIALYPDHAQNAESVVKNADVAMYQAKENGRNLRLLYHAGMTEHVTEQMTLEQDLQFAVETMEEFELYYQPKIDLLSGRICAAEALIRWNHPHLGLIYPDSFIPLAENIGMMTLIGEWIIGRCVRQIADWHHAHDFSLGIAVNLSGRQFQDNNLTAIIKKAIRRYDVNPMLLEFEITESLSMSNIEGTMRTLHELKNIGVTIAIDDFGTGYSSLSYLKQFPIDVLKIDKSFVMDMVDKPDERAIVEAIITMAHTLNYRTVAEGVETERQLQLLREMGCDSAQGYLFSKPLRIELFDRFFIAHAEQLT